MSGVQPDEPAQHLAETGTAAAGAVGPGSVTVISVAYASMAVLPEMARSLPDGVDLVIVDNGPDDGLRDWAREAGHRLIVPGRNLGFGTGCNLGARQSKAEFLFFLNPDTRLQPDTLDILLATARAHPSAAALGPEFLKESGKSFRYRPSRIMRRSERLVGPSRPTETLQVPSLNGAGLLCRRSAFEMVGGFDEALFLFFEDDDLSLRLAARAGPLLYVPAARAAHGLGRSSPASRATAFLKGYHYAWSHGHVLKKFGRRAPRLVPLLGAFRQFLSARVLTSATRRAYSRGRLIGAWDGLLGRPWQDSSAASPEPCSCQGSGPMKRPE